jgi:hypothetical protein
VPKLPNRSHPFSPSFYHAAMCLTMAALAHFIELSPCSIGDKPGVIMMAHGRFSVPLLLHLPGLEECLRLPRGSLTVIDDGAVL